VTPAILTRRFPADVVSASAQRSNSAIRLLKGRCLPAGAVRRAQRERARSGADVPGIRPHVIDGDLSWHPSAAFPSLILDLTDVFVEGGARRGSRFEASRPSGLARRLVVDRQHYRTSLQIRDGSWRSRPRSRI
jgi:hypothetical protein